jgi:SAM-dependent methyltransferase
LAARLLFPFVDPRRALEAVAAVPWFLSSSISYARRSDEKVSLLDLYPRLVDRRDAAGTFDAHYFYQDIWAATKVHESGCVEHVDIGSRVDGFIAHCACFTRVSYVDLRAVDLELHNVRTIRGTILRLPFETQSVFSLSSLHVVEHVGLGRYGDPLDPRGSAKAMAELCRVLAPGGNLYLSVPIGRERVCFNAHRIFSPRTILDACAGLDLVSFAAIGDDRHFVPHASLDDYLVADYACGLFQLRRPK